MGWFNMPDPWQDDTARRIERAKHLLMEIRGENLVERDHFPNRRGNQR